MADEKIRLTELPRADDLRDEGMILANQGGVDYALPATKLVRTDQNLADVDPAISRNNLDVYSKTEADENAKVAPKATPAATIDEGLSKTVSGELFVIPQGEGADRAFVYYRNNGGSAVAVAEEPGAGQVNRVAAQTEEIDLRTQGLNTRKESVNPYEMLDKEGKELLSMDDQARWNMPGGLKATDIEAQSMKVESLDMGQVEAASVSNGNERIELRDAPDYVYAETDLAGQVLFGTKKDGTKEYLGIPLEHASWLGANDIFYIGDSTTQFNEASSLGNTNINRNEAPAVCAQSFAMWAQMFSGGRLKYVGTAATGGYTTAQIRERHLPTAIARKPAYCFVLSGGNDVVQSIPNSTTIPLLIDIYTRLRQAGIIPILATTNANSNDTAAKNVIREGINSFIRQYAYKHRLPLVDLHEATVNPINGKLAGSNTIDGAHVNYRGAKMMARKMVAQLEPWLTGNVPPIAHYQSTPDYSPNTVTNPLFYDFANGVTPDAWQSNLIGTNTITENAQVKGKVLNIKGAGADRAIRYQTVAVEPGVRYGFGFMVRIPTDDVNHIYITPGSDYTATKIQAGMRQWVGQDDGDFGFFYQEFTAAADQTTATIVINTLDLAIGQVGVIKLPEVF